MNLIFLSLLFIFGSWLWKKSRVGVFNKVSVIAVGVLIVIWWFIWGQLAIIDQWWFYNENNLELFAVGYIPVADILYFLAGIGWHIYFGSKLKLFD